MRHLSVWARVLVLRCFRWSFPGAPRGSSMRLDGPVAPQYIPCMFKNKCIVNIIIAPSGAAVASASPAMPCVVGTTEIGVVRGNA